MKNRTPRMRMFAGPNGSGKSVLKEVVHSRWLGVYVNADEIEKTMRSLGGVALSDFKMSLSDEEFLERFGAHSLAGRVDASVVSCADGFFSVPDDFINSYYAAIFADLIRHFLLETGISFTFETVMSHRSKVDLLQLAREKGFRTYVYFIATEDPKINVARVAQRVGRGGHDVPEDKILSRYDRSIHLLSTALIAADRGFVFDNSGSREIWVAETVGDGNGARIEFRSSEIPRWVEAILPQD